MGSTASVPRSGRRVKVPRQSAEGLSNLLRGVPSPEVVSTPRGVLRPYRRALLPDGRSVLRKRVGPEHELRVPPGVAVDEAVLDEAERAGLAGVVIERVSTGAVVWAPLKRWKSGLPIRRGFGPQRALLWTHLAPVGAGSTTLEQSAQETHTPVQGSLFATL